MYTLGINAAFHDSAAALIKDGVLIAAAEDERFTHIKHGKRPVPFTAILTFTFPLTIKKMKGIMAGGKHFYLATT